MKKLLILVTALVVATSLVVGCAGGNPHINSQQPIDTGVGEEFLIALDSNPTTGYDWEVDYDVNVLTLVNKEYDTAKCPGLVGAGGTQYFTFKALKDGTTKITLNYKRSWEEEILSTEIFTINIK